MIIDYYRAPTARREVASGNALDLASSDGAPGEASVEEEEERAALRELATCLAPMIGQLPPAYREAVTLTDIERASQADAAARAGVSLSGMKSRVQRGRRQLRAVLDACCRVDLDSRGTIVAYDPRTPDSCSGRHCR